MRNNIEIDNLHLLKLIAHYGRQSESVGGGVLGYRMSALHMLAVACALWISSGPLHIPQDVRSKIAHFPLFCPRRFGQFLSGA
jgi:hypothetical protein